MSVNFSSTTKSEIAMISMSSLRVTTTYDTIRRARKSSASDMAAHVPNVKGNRNIRDGGD